MVTTQSSSVTQHDAITSENLADMTSSWDHTTVPVPGQPICDDYGEPGFTEKTWPDRYSSGLPFVTMVIIPNFIVIGCLSWSFLKTRHTSLVLKLMLMALAFTDISYGFGSGLVQVLRYKNGFCATGGEPVCVGQAFFSNIVVQLSILIVLLMGLDRYCALCHPFKYHRIFTPTKVAIMLFLAFLYSTIISALPLMGVNQYALGSMGCDFQWDDTSSRGSGYVYFRAAQALIFTVVLLILNFISMREVCVMNDQAKQTTDLQQTEQYTDSNQPTTKTTTSRCESFLQKRILFLVILVSLAAVICNFPYVVRLVQMQMGIDRNHSVPTYIVKRMLLSNAIVNPCLTLLFYVSGLVRCNTRETSAGGISLQQTTTIQANQDNMKDDADQVNTPSNREDKVSSNAN